MVDDPESQLRRKGGCDCFCCLYFKPGSHLKPKKLKPEDKRRAAKLKRDYLEQLGLDTGVRVPDVRLEKLLNDTAISRDAAMGAYAVQLLRRCAGLSTTPAVLALWREIAWTRTNAPDRNFKLSAELVLAAEARLLKLLTAASNLTADDSTQ